MTIDTHNKAIEFGRYHGELWTRLPVSYLRWMVQQQTRDDDYAKAELDRRGISVTDDGVEISGHAIDTASLRAWAEYRHDRNENEGLHAWLKRIATEALEGGNVDDKGRVLWNGRVALAVEHGPLVVIVKTVIMLRNGK